MKKLITILFFAATFFNTNLSAQTYNTAVGLRLGSPSSASIKHFINENSALEGYVGFRGFSNYFWTTVSSAYLYHQPIGGVDGLQWYAGGGASVYFWSFDFNTTANSTTFGVQGYLGLDYKFENAPINLTIDWIPSLFFNGFVSGFGGGYGSLGARYVLK